MMDELIARKQFEAELNYFIVKVYGVIDDARNKTSNEEREKTDGEAKIILTTAT
jgi:hypothetical protein